MGDVTLGGVVGYVEASITPRVKVLYVGTTKISKFNDGMLFCFNKKGKGVYLLPFNSYYYFTNYAGTVVVDVVVIQAPDEESSKYSDPSAAAKVSFTAVDSLESV